MAIEDGRIVADAIFENGTVLTVDRSDSVAQAVAVLGDRIVAVGGAAEVRRCKGNATRVVDLKGATLIPGMIDNHTHPLLGGLSAPEVGAKVDIQAADSIAAIKAEIAAAAVTAEPGEWISTSPMYRGALKEGRFPDRYDLDEVAPNNPVYVMQGGKGMIVNSRALEFAGIDAGTLDPLGDPDVSEGHIVKDENGEPTGFLAAGAADLARKRWWDRLGLPPKKWEFIYHPHETMVDALRAQHRRFNAVGVTGTRDMGLSPDEIDAYVDLAARGEATVRTDLIMGMPDRYLPIDEVDRTLTSYFGAKQGIASEWLRLGGLKLVVQNDGWWSYSPEKLERIVMVSNRFNWTLSIHGMPCDLGDSIEVLLDILEAADRENPIKGRRFSYEHCFGLLNPKHYDRLLRLGFLMAPNPLLSSYGAARTMQMHEVMDGIRLRRDSGDGLEIEPRERAAREWGTPIRSWIDAGFVVTGGTDFPAVDYDMDHPFAGFALACAQVDRERELLPGEGVTPAEALRMWTINGAYATFQEHDRGSLEPGKLADMVVLSDNPLAVEPAALNDIQVLETVVGGNTVHQRG